MGDVVHRDVALFVAPEIGIVHSTHPMIRVDTILRQPYGTCLFFQTEQVGSFGTSYVQKVQRANWTGQLGFSGAVTEVFLLC